MCSEASGDQRTRYLQSLAVAHQLKFDVEAQMIFGQQKFACEQYHAPDLPRPGHDGQGMMVHCLQYKCSSLKSHKLTSTRGGSSEQPLAEQRPALVFHYTTCRNTNLINNSHNLSTGMLKNESKVWMRVTGLAPVNPLPSLLRRESISNTILTPLVKVQPGYKHCTDQRRSERYAGPFKISTIRRCVLEDLTNDQSSTITYGHVDSYGSGALVVSRMVI
jgi:hypothetical protein